MKKIFLLLFSVIFIFSCNKDKLTENNLLTYSKVKATGMYNVTLDVLGWLQFTDRQHIMSVLDNLQISTDNYDNQYATCLDQIPDGLTYEQEQSAIQQCGYIEDKPTLDFVNSFGGSYSCIYTKVETDIDNWLNQQTPPINFSNMPDHDLDDPIIGAVYNQYGEVQVGGIVYFTKSDGRQIGVKRDYLTYEIVQNLRTIFADPNFDPTSYTSTQVTGDSLIDAFLFGEQMNNKRISGKGNGVGYSIFQATITVVGFPIFFLYDLEKWNYSPGGSCHLEKDFDPLTWYGSNRKMICHLRFKNWNVIGSWERAMARCYELNSNKKRLGNMMVDANLEAYYTDIWDCNSHTDDSFPLTKDKKKKKIVARRAVGLYSRYATEQNNSSHDFFHSNYYFNGNLKKVIH